VTSYATSLTYLGVNRDIFSPVGGPLSGHSGSMYRVAPCRLRRRSVARHGAGLWETRAVTVKQSGVRQAVHIRHLAVHPWSRNCFCSSVTTTVSAKEGRLSISFHYKPANLHLALRFKVYRALGIFNDAFFSTTYITNRRMVRWIRTKNWKASGLGQKVLFQHLLGWNELKKTWEHLLGQSVSESGRSRKRNMGANYSMPNSV